MGEDNYGIEPESSEQGTFSKKTPENTVCYSSPRLKTSKNKNWTRLVAQENEEMYKILVCFSNPRIERSMGLYRRPRLDLSEWKLG